jgi:hypothetical protein
MIRMMLGSRAGNCGHVGSVAAFAAMEPGRLGWLGDRRLCQSGAASDEPLGPQKQHQDQEGTRRVA